MLVSKKISVKICLEVRSSGQEHMGFVALVKGFTLESKK